MKVYYTIRPTKNGYVITLYSGDGRDSEWIARSWAEVGEVLEEIGAPDFVEEGTK